MKLLITLCLAIAISFPGFSQKSQEIKEPTPIFSNFLSSYNTNNSDSLKEFIINHYQEEFLSNSENIQKEVIYWRKLFASYGPMDFYKSGSSPTIVWLKGKISNSWIRLEFSLNDLNPPRIKNRGIRKGVRPPSLGLSAKLTQKDIHGLLAEYFDKMEENNLFSGAVAVGIDTTVIFKGAYGYSDIQKKVKNNLNTSFNIASTGKMFTGVAIAQLIEKGRLALTDTLSEYIPEYPKHIASKVTIKDLLTHTSGIELDNIEAFNKATQEAKNVEDLLLAQLRYIDSLEHFANFEDQYKFNYSNEGINLLGVIIERVSGLSYEDYLQNYIFHPADMENAGLNYLNSPSSLANGYVLSIEHDSILLIDNKNYLPKKAYPAGAHYASINDMVKFLKALTKYSLTSKMMFDDFTSFQIIEAKLPNVTYGYGYTFEIIERDGFLSFGHSGGMPGVSTKFEVYPKDHVWIIVLANRDEGGTIATTYIRELLIYKR